MMSQVMQVGWSNFIPPPRIRKQWHIKPKKLYQKKLGFA